MKKLLKWVFPAILGIAPAMGAEGLPFAVINDPFFTARSTTCSIDSFIENDGKFFASVTGISHAEFNEGDPVSKTDYFKAASKVLNIKHDDAKLIAYETILLQVGLAGTAQPLTKQFTRELPYTLIGKSGEGKFVKGIALKESDALPVGEPVEVREILRYQRPGDLTEAQPFEKPGPLLYHLLLEETVTPIGSGWIATCTGCGKKDGYQGVLHSGGKHNLQAYSNAREVRQTLWQIPPHGDKIKKEETTKKHAKIATLYDGRRDHNIKSDLQAADYRDDLTGWILS